MKHVKHLTDQILADSKQHGSIPFWSWNDKLEAQELCRQIQHMSSLGMRGFFMHARGGLETEYLSREWFDAIHTCIDEAKKLGMEAWAYDENGWPSGFAGGELLKDPKNHACGLVMETLDTYPAENENLLGVYRLSDTGVEKLSQDDGKGRYLAVYRKRDFSYVDVMNGEITKQFLKLSHERYEREIGKEHFGSTMPGFFTDEPQYFRYGTPWSDTFPKRFFERFGYDVTSCLPALFLDFAGAEEFRYDYHLLCHELFYGEFMKPVYDWCTEHGVRLTGHGIEEWGLGGQMMCCGGVMPFYLYEHLPGIDYLGRGVKNISGAKQLGSVCAQAGKKTALSEMFACCGWDVTPRELKRIAELQFAGGVNLICEHLYAYSERGQRKRDFPNHYSEHNPWSVDFGAFETYFQHLGAALVQGEEMADTLVIHPIRSAYLHYKHTVHNVGNTVAGNDASGIADAEAAFEDLVQKLTLWQIPYHFGDETVMKQLGAYAENGTLRIGNCRYSRVILSGCETLDHSTVEVLEAFLATGGTMLVEGKVPCRMDGKRADLSFLKGNTDWQALRASCGISVTQEGRDVPLHLQIRTVNGARLVFLANTSEKSYEHIAITLPHCRGLREINVDTLAEKPLFGHKNADGSLTVYYDFADSASCLLAECDAPVLAWEAPRKPMPLVLPQAFRLCEQPENMLLMENASISTDGIHYTEPRPIARIRDNLLREQYRGPLFMQFAFQADCVPKQLLLVGEPIKDMRFSINGITISPMQEEWRIDRRFCVYDIAAYTQRGENTVQLQLEYYQSDKVFRVLYGGGNEALRNCLCFDTEPEAVYLFGSFTVRSVSGLRDTAPGILQSEGPFVLEEQTNAIDLYDINRSGYPFFAGTLRAKGTLLWYSGMDTRLTLGGRFATSGVCINGHELGMQLFGGTFELSPYLREGENELILTLRLSNRNLLGPHHTLEPEPLFVTPRTFSFERAWEDGNCPNYRPDLSFVRFGIGF